MLTEEQIETLKDFIQDHDFEDALIEYVDELDKENFKDWLGWNDTDMED